MKKLFFDMDGVLADFESGLERVDDAVKNEFEGRYDEIPGLFSLMTPIAGAIEAVETLSQHYDVFILSTAPWGNPTAWIDKRIWVEKYFKDIFYKRMIITHRKDLVHGDYLIDDRAKNGTSEFTGEWIQFGSEDFPDWNSVVSYLSKKDGW
jgi:5'(3')-deoxyribonucleotidase